MLLIYWRESVYQNNFHCNICGSQLLDKDGNPCYTVKNPDFLQCRQCRNVVAQLERTEDNGNN